MLNKIYLIISLIVIVTTFFLFYPPMYGIMDEASYLSTAYVMQKGTFFYDEANVEPSIGTIIGEKHNFSKYPPGNAILLIPFTSIHWKLGFLRTFIFYIAGFFIFLQILKHYSIDPVFSLLYLLHPVLVLYSRTIMSDVPSLFFILLGFYLIIENKDLASGFLLGVSLLIRYTNVIILIGIAGGLLFNKSYKKIVLLLPGIVSFFIVYCIYNNHVQGGVFAPFLLTTSRSAFSLKYLLSSGVYYIIALNVLYPLMLFIFLFVFYKEKHLLMATSGALLLLIFYSLYYYLDKGFSSIETLVRGQRFIIPVLPFFLLTYSFFINSRPILKKIFIFIIPLLLIFSACVQYKHFQFLKERKELQVTVLRKTEKSDIIIMNGEAGELFNPFTGSRNWNNFYVNNQLVLDKELICKHKNPYLVYIESGKHPEEKRIFFDYLLKIFNTEKIYETQIPRYIVIFRLCPKVI